MTFAVVSHSSNTEAMRDTVQNGFKSNVIMGTEPKLVLVRLHN